MVRILFYGGCHALVLRDLIRERYTARDVQASLIVNFVLIASAQPFPYDRLRDFDVVVFSPIENKGDYNTSELVARCDAIGIKTVVFPWIEWHGYCPGAHKGLFKGRFQWYYPKLLDIASRFDRLDDFIDHVVDTYPSDDEIDQTFERTTDLVQAAEARYDMQVHISDFILGNYRHSRLFLISDHPSGALYKHVLDQIVTQIGLSPRPRSSTGAVPTSMVEPQWRWRTPIFPRVGRHLKLDFDDSQWIDDELVPGRSWGLRTYLSLYFYPESVILGPIDRAPIFDRPARSEAVVAMAESPIRLFARPVETAGADGLDEYQLLEMLAGGANTLSPNAHFGIRAEQWRSTWAF